MFTYIARFNTEGKTNIPSFYLFLFTVIFSSKKGKHTQSIENTGSYYHHTALKTWGRLIKASLA